MFGVEGIVRLKDKSTGLDEVIVGNGRYPVLDIGWGGCLYHHRLRVTIVPRFLYHHIILDVGRGVVGSHYCRYHVVTRLLYLCVLDVH